VKVICSGPDGYYEEAEAPFPSQVKSPRHIFSVPQYGLYTLSAIPNNENFRISCKTIYANEPHQRVDLYFFKKTTKNYYKNFEMTLSFLLLQRILQKPLFNFR
jgi:hypothetical protein